MVFVFLSDVSLSVILLDPCSSSGTISLFLGPAWGTKLTTMPSQPWIGHTQLWPFPSWHQGNVLATLHQAGEGIWCLDGWQNLGDLLRAQEQEGWAQQVYHLLWLPPSQHLIVSVFCLLGFPGGSDGRVCLPMSSPWVRKIPWRREWQPTPVFLPEESHRQRSLVGYSPWGRRVGHDWETNTLNTFLFWTALNSSGKWL